MAVDSNHPSGYLGVMRGGLFCVQLGVALSVLSTKEASGEQWMSETEWNSRLCGSAFKLRSPTPAVERGVPDPTAEPAVVFGS